MRNMKIEDRVLKGYDGNDVHVSIPLLVREIGARAFLGDDTV